MELRAELHIIPPYRSSYFIEFACDFEDQFIEHFIECPRQFFNLDVISLFELVDAVVLRILSEVTGESEEIESFKAECFRLFDHFPCRIICPFEK